MNDMRRILMTEINNKSAIYLYEHGDKWYAYEHSAYHFWLVFKIGRLMRMDQYISIVIDSKQDFINLPAMKDLHIGSVANSELKIDCKTTFPGFEQWKDEQFTSK